MQFTVLPVKFQRSALAVALWLAFGAGMAGTVSAMAQPGEAQPGEALQDLEALLGTEVEGPSRQLESALDAAAVVSFINRPESAALGHRTVADMMERLPGIYLSTTRAYSNVGFRGINRQGDLNKRLLMSIDGYRVNDPVNNQAQPAWEFPIVADWIKRLELVSGPASSVYGGNAMLGVVNAVTLDGRDAPGVHVRAGVANWHTRDAVLNYGWHDRGADLFMGLALRDTRGETLQSELLRGPAAPDGRVSGLDGMSYHSLFLKWRLDGWRVSLASHERVKDLPVTPYGTMPGVPGTSFTDRYSYGELAWEGSWVEDWRPSVRMYAVRSGIFGRYMMGSVDAPVVRHEYGSGNGDGADTRLQWRGWINHEFTLGAEVRRIYNAVQRKYNEAPYQVDLDWRTSQNQSALYAQDHWRLAERWSLTMGSRVDRVQGYPSAFSPRLALVMRPNEFEAFKLLYGQGFRVPGLNERADENAGLATSSPLLKPERLRSVAVAWERAVGQRSRVSVHAYRDRLRDLIDFVPTADLSTRYSNRPPMYTHGLDVEVQGVFDGGVQWRTSVTAQGASTEGSNASATPRWMSKGHLISPLPRQGWSTALQWMALGRRGPTVPTRITVDGLLRWEPQAGSSLSLRASNLFNAVTWDPAESPLLPRYPRERRSIGIEWQQAL